MLLSIKLMVGQASMAEKIPKRKLIGGSDSRRVHFAAEGFIGAIHKYGEKPLDNLSVEVYLPSVLVFDSRFPRRTVVFFTFSCCTSMQRSTHATAIVIQFSPSLALSPLRPISRVREPELFIHST